MIGEIRKVLTPFYDMRTHRQSVKSRPGLIIAQADSDDYVILPVSRVSDQRRIDPVYDLRVDPAVYPALRLNAVSYIRTHKQTIVHRGEISDLISDMRSSCEELYIEALTKRAQFSDEITNQAL